MAADSIPLEASHRPEETNRKIRLFSIRVGEKDFALEPSRALGAMLTEHGIEHRLEINEGGHTRINWQLYLSELLPELFREGPPATD